MARIASQALGGYYALPEDHTKPIASLIDVSALMVSGGSFAVCDPCAADGQAILTMLAHWAPPKPYVKGSSEKRLEILAYLAELELERSLKLKSNVNRALGWEAEQKRVIRGDAFRVVWESQSGRLRGGCQILFLNPPYDDDRLARRLEHRFLVRFTDVITPGYGVLIFVVPFHALVASAEFLAAQYERIHCFRFFPDTFDEYGQVVLVAMRRLHPLDDPDGAEVERIMGWAKDADTIPELERSPRPVLTLTRGGSIGLTTWEIAPLDLLALRRQVQIGADAGGRGIKRYGLDRDVGELSGAQKYLLAMPPRPGHIAQALAAGLLTGSVLRPDDPSTGLPELLAKGTFERELFTIEEKTNKAGETTSYVQIQQPSLRLCVLDIGAGQYYNLGAGSVPSGSTDLTRMNVADLLHRYRGSLGEVMATMCPAIHPLNTPEAALPLPPLGREPYRAQKEAIYATLKLLARREQPFCIGEVGTGKSTIALATAAALHASHLPELKNALEHGGHPSTLEAVERVLIVCPPHLLQSWVDQVGFVLPSAGVVVIERISDVWQERPIREGPGAGITVYILSRETAKLSHGVEAGLANKRTCPRCGRYIHLDDDVIVKERARCEYARRRPANDVARLSADLARLLIPVMGTNARVASLTPERNYRQYAWNADARIRALPKEEQSAAARAAWERRWRGGAAAFDETPLGRLIMRWVEHIRGRWNGDGTGEQMADDATTLGYLFLAARADAEPTLARVVIDLFAMTKGDPYRDGRGSNMRDKLRPLLALMTPGSELQTATIDTIKAMGLDRARYSYEQGSNPWKYLNAAIPRLLLDWERARQVAAGDLPIEEAEKVRPTFEWGHYPIHITPHGDWVWEKVQGGPHAALHALERLAKDNRYSVSPICDEPLHAAVPTPRRYSVAKYITRYAKRRFDLLFLDEGHEFAGDGSAQEIASHRLSEMGLPTLLLTGSLMSGYASGLFRNLWALSRRFRREFGRDEVRAFVTRYGYRRVLSEPVEDEVQAAIATYGSHTDRREVNHLKMIRTLGEAPGVLPLLLLQHLLPVAVTIQKSDLDDALPPCPPPKVIPVPFDHTNAADAALYNRGRKLFSDVADQIGKDAFSELSGKLFGALGQLPSYYDRSTADTGNCMRSDGSKGWEVRYPVSVGGGLVSSAELLDPSVLLPKERWLVRTLKSELAEDRNVVVYVTHSGSGAGALPARLARIIAEQVGETPVILDANKAPTRRREQWINEQVIAKGRRIMIANPVTVQTGLNNLVWFATCVHLENCNTNAIVFRQSNGRLHRIGQTKEVRILVPVYADTPQVLAQELLTRKIMASEQVDGMDVQAALEAAGAGQRDAIDTLELGRAIYAMLIGERVMVER